ncbi:substrate-binding periplasmic protein [Marinobacter sediminum]|uniref:substrate-binding periplasmic protein n=1 Tax=Marinobacter sediminum TaxID=256323 RepID=UPI0019396640|nr:transporter substrate-binding domain-containing protein [Marinobacter sediminum]
MKIAAKSLLCSFGLLAFSPAWSESQTERSLTVSIAAPAYWCLYACNSAGSRLGFTVDIARAALESEGVRVVYKNLPFDRALFETKSGRIDAVIPAFKDEAPNFIFPPFAVSLTEYCFYVPKNESRRYEGMASLKSMHFVATSGYSYGKEMDAYISDNEGGRVTLIGGDDVPNRLRELVRLERVDALLDDRLLFESSRNRVDLVNAGCLNERHAGYLALSPKNSDRSYAIARAFSRGFEHIRESGQLCKILDSYGLGTDVVPGLNAGHCRSDAPSLN